MAQSRHLKVPHPKARTSPIELLQCSKALGVTLMAKGHLETRACGLDDEEKAQTMNEHVGEREGELAV